MAGPGTAFVERIDPHIVQVHHQDVLGRVQAQGSGLRPDAALGHVLAVLVDDDVFQRVAFPRPEVEGVARKIANAAAFLQQVQRRLQASAWRARRRAW